MELDHIFMFVAPDSDAIDRLSALGLVETYRRTHPGQGTTNVCYCFDNLFLELLWVTDSEEASSPLIKRTLLLERSQWVKNGANRFGIAWRGTSDIEVWNFAPPYLPDGLHIPVAIDSDDLTQPMMFQSPGTLAPKDMPPTRRGVLQQPAGYTDVRKVELILPKGAKASGALMRLVAQTILEVRTGDVSSATISLRLEHKEGGTDSLHLPACTLTS